MFCAEPTYRRMWCWLAHTYAAREGVSLEHHAYARCYRR